MPVYPGAPTDGTFSYTGTSKKLRPVCPRVFSGQDNGPPEPMFEVGDVYPGGPRNGKHFDITEVTTGEMARGNGCGVMIVGKERDVSKAN